MPAVYAADPKLNTVILAVILNGQSVNQHFFLLSAEQQIFASAETLLDLGLKPQLWQAYQHKKHIALSQLAPALQIDFDELKGQVSLQIEPLFFKDQHFGLKQPLQTPHTTVKNQAFSFLLNYQLQVDSNRKQGLQGVSLPIEIALRANNWLFYNRFYLQKQPHKNGSYQRLLSQMIYDNPENMYRLTLGDFVDNGIYAGIALKRQFQFQPSYRSFPRLNLSYLNPIASDAQLYIDNVLIDRWRLQPGSVFFSDIYQRIGSGQARLLIKDILNNKHTLIKHFRINQGQLNSGVHDYAYHFGFKRENIIHKNNDYGSAMLSGLHRLGLNDAITVSGSFRLTKQQLNLQLSTNVKLVSALYLNLGLAFNHNRQQQSYGLSLASSYQWSRLNLSLGMNLFSKDDNNRLNNVKNIKHQTQVSSNLQLGKNWGILSINFINTQWHSNAETTRQWSLNYNNRLFSQVRLLVSARYQQPQQDQTLFIALQYQAPKKPRFSYNFYQKNKSTKQQIKVSQNQTKQNPFAYDLALQQSNNQTTALNSRLYYRGKYAEYSSHFLHTESDDTLNFNMTGSIAGFDLKNGYFSRPIHDSFALVKTGHPNVAIKAGGSINGVTNTAGHLLIPDINAWYENQISVSEKDLALNYQVGQALQYVQSSYRSGTIVEFDIERFNAIEGYLFKDNKALVNVTFEFLTDKGVQQSFTGNNGYFYLENIMTGSYQFKMMIKNELCHINVDVTDTKAIVKNLGNLSCE